jgi:putative salt-induced outer membrane protein YdiY
MPMPTLSFCVLRVLFAVALLVAPLPALGQTPAQPVVLPPTQPPPPPPPAPPPPPPPGWAGSLGAGYAFTSGNSDTSTGNLAYEVLRDTGTNVVLKSTGLYLRGESEGVATVQRAAADARLDYRLTPRLSAFGLTTFAHDRFKDIDYLVAPTAGLSYAVVKTERVEWTTDGSVGVVFEKNTGFDVDTAGALLGGERLQLKLSDATRITHAASGLWKMNDFDDSFYNFSVGLATSLASRFELKVEFLNTYKNKPTNPTLEKGDQSVVMAIVYKF